MKPGFYRQEICFSRSNDQFKVIWTVPNRYTYLNYIGCGNFSYVCSAFDNVLQRKVAIKKLKDGRSIIWIRTYREIKVLQHVTHDNIVCLIDAFTPNESLDTFEELYLVMPLMDKTLQNVCERYADDRVQTLMYQLFRALKYLHSARLVHRDLKPSNIGVTADDELKLLDMGLARYRNEETDTMTAYVMSRCFRAPEVLLNPGQYTEEVDIWAAGCIMAQLLTGKQLFTAKNPIQLLKQMFSLVGGPNDDFIGTFEGPIQSCVASHKGTRRTLDECFCDLSTSAVNLLDQLLVVDYRHRITAEQALRHSYFQNYQEEGEEPNSCAFEDPLRCLENSDNHPWKESVWQLLQNIVPNLSSFPDLS